MLYLNPNSFKIQKAKEEFHNEMELFLIKRFLNFYENKMSKYDNSITLNTIFQTLIEPNIEVILTGQPQNLIRLSDNYSSLIQSTPNLKTAIEYVFSYKTFIRKTASRYDAYDLANSLDIRTCPYCNRSYTTVIRKKNGKKISRPQFDHFFDKSSHPLLALSFFNLIPSCSICNSTVKGRKQFTIKSHLHPYLDDNVDQITFSFKYSNESFTGIEVVVITENNSKASKTVEDFAIQEIYNSHTNELQDLLKTRLFFSQNYLQNLKNTLLVGLDISDDEMYRILFGTEFQTKNFLNRPFSKFKKDILTELGIA